MLFERRTPAQRVTTFVFDVVDGPVTARARGRGPDQSAFGANLDSLADVVSAGVALGAVILAYGEFRLAYLPFAIVIGQPPLRASAISTFPDLTMTPATTAAYRPTLPSLASWP